MAREDEVRLIAYAIWEEEGYSHGRDTEHWFRAEAIWEERQKPEAAARKIEAGPKKTTRRTSKTASAKKSVKTRSA